MKIYLKSFQKIWRFIKLIPGVNFMNRVQSQLTLTTYNDELLILNILFYCSSALLNGGIQVVHICVCTYILCGQFLSETLSLNFA
jgi:hypothetical protein